MLVLNSPLERSTQPPLEPRGDVMHARHDFLGVFVAVADDGHAMFVPCRWQAGGAFPPVSMDCRARLHGLANEGPQALGGDILDASQSDTADSLTLFLRRDHTDGLFLDLTAPLALLGTSHVGFIDLNLASEAITARSYHGSAQFVPPCPGRCVAAQAQHTVQAQGADAIRLPGGEPYRKEPHSSWRAGVLEHRVGRQRRVAMTSLASKDPACHDPRLPENPATPATESVGPPPAADIVATTRLSAEPLVHFFKCPRVIGGSAQFRIFHGAMVSAVARGVKGIPIYRILGRRKHTTSESCS